MSAAQAFELIREEQIEEVNSLARYYRHKKTGAEIISLANDDENKVFGIAFKTPPADSTGIAHILEHSVLCGSQRYPVKKPFVEMLKGSVHTFLNAMTYPDKTIYPVASQNEADFYNLATVYLDAVLFPLLTEETFMQEGWHYELENPDEPLRYKGVVFNEMKGDYSSPDSVLRWTTSAALYPDTIYGNSSGGDPKVMPSLTYEQFKAFHSRYYHPSNAQIIFYGDDDEDRRLALLEDYLSRFEPGQKAPEIPLQPRFSEPRSVVATYPADEARKANAFFTLNWMWDEEEDQTENLIRSVLSSALLGTSAAPLRKALTDSGLGESVIGGLSGYTRQPSFSAGLRGIDPDRAGAVEALVLRELEALAANGIDQATVEATVNSLEFRLREMNTGGAPRGLVYFTSALSDWLHGRDPLDALKYEEALAALKSRLASGEPVLEDRIRSLILDNTHRVSVLLKADTEQGARDAKAERETLDAARAAMDADRVNQVIETTKRLKALQNAPDKPEDLRKIPTLTLADLPREINRIETEDTVLSGVRTLFHEQPTNGIVYLDLAFDLKALPAELLQYLPIFSRALTQTGTGREDFVALSQRIGRLTGGVAASRLISAPVEGDESVARLVLRGKSVADKTPDLLEIFRDVLLDARLDNRERIAQMALEDKARFEASLVPSGHVMAMTRLRAAFTEADWLNEQMGGISYLFFLRELVGRIETDWPTVQRALESIRDILVAKSGLILNVTTERGIWTEITPQLDAFVARLPAGTPSQADWGSLPAPRNEGLTIPAQVNYVAKGVNLKKLGYIPSAALTVVTKYLGTAYLWDKIRVEGGAYGGFARFDPLAGTYSFGSYRDPNLLETLDVYDKTAEVLREGVDENDVTRSIIGTIGDMDGMLLPDAKGYTALVRILTGATDAYRQQRRDQVLSTTEADFRAAADLLAEVARNGHVVVIGSENAISEANRARNGFLDVTKVL